MGTEERTPVRSQPQSGSTPRASLFSPRTLVTAPAGWEQPRHSRDRSCGRGDCSRDPSRDRSRGRSRDRGGSPYENPRTLLDSDTDAFADRLPRSYLEARAPKPAPARASSGGQRESPSSRGTSPPL